MITMQISMTVPAGTETAWEQVRREAHRAYPPQPGFLGARVLHDCDHPAHYVMQSDWRRARTPIAPCGRSGCPGGRGGWA